MRRPDRRIPGQVRRPGINTGRAVGAEQLGRHRHVQGLVGQLVIVGGDPAADRFLGDRDGLERCYVVEEFGAQRLVEPINLPVVGDRGLVSRCLIPLSRQIFSNNTSTGNGYREARREWVAEVINALLSADERAQLGAVPQLLD